MNELRFELDCDTTLPHFHEELEIFYVLSGRCAVMTQKTNFLLSSEDFAVFNPYEHHEHYKEAGCHTLSAFISLPILQQAELGRVDCCSYKMPDKADHLRLIRANLALIFKNEQDPSGKLRLQSLSHLFGILSVLKLQFEVVDSDRLAEMPDIGRLQRALDYIGRHYCEELSMQEVAQWVHLSKSQLSRDFQRIMNESFSDYLRHLRLNHASYLLRSTDRSITDIALDSGFSNSNTLIINFRQEYGETPGSYRKRLAQEKQTEKDQPMLPKNSYTYMSLLKYAAKEEALLPLSTKKSESVRISVDVTNNCGPIHLPHDEVISVGWAVQLLHENTRNALRMAAEQIGFAYYLVHGILDDSMDVYHEDENGTPWLSFTYLDLVLDFLIDIGVRPFLMLSFTPNVLANEQDNQFGGSNIYLPRDLDRWHFLIHGVMDHFKRRYGADEVSRWRFAPEQAVLIEYDVFSMEEYLHYYLETERAVHEVLPDAAFYGPGLDIGFLEEEGPELLYQYLDFCKEYDCLPNALLMQCFCCDYSKQSRKETEKRIRSNPNQQDIEPVAPDDDPFVLRRQLTVCRQMLTDHGYGELPVGLFSWNTTLWQNDLTSDTCFKAAAVVHHMLESRHLLAFAAYGHLSDNNDRRVIYSNLYHGGCGLTTYNGIPKAGYYAMLLLTWMRQRAEVVVAEGKGYFVSRSANRKQVQILLYHYCHYDMENHLNTVLPIAEQRTMDRYTMFEKNGMRSYAFHLSGLLAGDYLKRSFSVNREHGSSYDFWMQMGEPDLYNHTQTQYLFNISTFGVVYQELHITEQGELDLSTVLDEHEVRLMLLDYR